MPDEYKSFDEIPRRPKDSVESVHSREKIKIHVPAPREPVVNSETGYKPIDRVAARVIMPAPDLCQPPRPPPKFMPKQGVHETTLKDPNRFPDSKEGASVRTARRLTEDGHVEEMLDMQDCAVMATDTHLKTVKDGVTASQELVAKAQDVIATVDYLSNQMSGPYSEFADFVKKALGEIREQRIALGMETRQLMASLKEVRQFFLDSDYTEQVKRLHEFVDICERLRALKEDGMLDAVADTILKL